MLYESYCKIIKQRHKSRLAYHRSENAADHGLARHELQIKFQ